MKKNILMMSLLSTSMFASCVSSATAEPVRTSSAARKSPAATATKSAVSESGKSETAAIKLGGESAEPAKVQEEFQKEFARDVAAAGPKAEGWALFSDSGMGYPGQRWVIRANSKGKETLSFCNIKQNEKKCTKRAISRSQFDLVAPTFAKANKLPHLLPTSFDGINFEYLHAKTGIPITDRVVFISSATPFPPEYEAIVTAFKSLSDGK